jgi:glycosyltransferase involved in cell wall biosynthesis
MEKNLGDTTLMPHRQDDDSRGLLTTVTLLDPLQVSQKPKTVSGLDLTIDPQRIIVARVKEQVTVVVPTLNEAGAISKVIEELKEQGYHKIIVVDGYSSDATDRIAYGNGVKLAYQHGIGKAGAVKTAIEHENSPYLLFMDGDGTYDPGDIWRLLSHADHYSHVIGARDKKHIGLVHRFGNWVISQLFSSLFGVKLTDVCSGMYLLETAEAKNYNLDEPGFVAEIELAAQSAMARRLVEVPINYRPRIGRRKLSTWRDGRAIISAAFKLAWRYNPVLICSGLAGLLAIPAASILLWVVFEYFTKATWNLGWALAGTVMLILSTQALTLAGVSLLTKNVEKRMPQVRNLDSPKSSGLER